MRGLKIQAGSGSRLYPSGSLLAGSPIPPIPDTADMFACWSTFGITANWQNNFGLILAVGDSTSGDISSTAVEPYPLDWASVVGIVGANPVMSEWKDQTAGNDLSQGDDPSFRPAINITDQRFDFDGTDDYLYRASLSGSDVTTVTVYNIFRTGTFGAVRPIWASGYDTDFGTLRSIGLGYIDDSGRYVAVQTGSSGADINSRRISLSANTTYITTTVYDRDQINPNDQTLLLLNNSSTGVNVVSNVDMAADSFSFSTNNFALGRAEIDAASQYFNGAMMHQQMHNTAHNETLRNEWYARLAYMVEYAGW